jgi:nucleotide-binding universal stress UspA family protein
MFMEIGLDHRVGHCAEQERWLASRATVAALAAVLLAFTGVIASVVGFRATDSAAIHALITAPFPLAVIAAALSFGFRRESCATSEPATVPGNLAGTLEESASTELAAPRVPRAAWNRICCPVDFSRESWFAMEEAAYLAWRFGAGLTLVHVRDRVTAPERADAAASSQTLDQRPLVAAQQRISDWANAADRIAPRPVAYSLLTGDPAQEIVRFAAEGRFGVLVIGASADPRRGRERAGSIVPRVVLEAPCSVLVARPRLPQGERRTP